MFQGGASHYRYYAAVKALKREIGLFNNVNGTRMYKLEPILLQENVDGSILEELSPLVGDVYVKLVVRNSCLYITNLSDGYAHGAAVTEMVAQGGVWSRHVFSIKSHTVLSSDDKQHASAPDLVIEVPTGHLAAGEISARLAVMEHEVNHRTTEQMKEDLFHYFYEPNVFCVIGIKMFPRDRLTPGQRAMAVQWTRQPHGDISVTGVWDFGILPCFAYSRTLFARVGANALSPVNAALWAQNRHHPMLENQLPAVAMPRTSAQFVEAVRVFISTLLELGPQMITLYGAASPLAEISCDRMVAHLHNLPAGTPPLIPLLGNFRLDLGRILYAAQRGAPTA